MSGKPTHQDVTRALGCDLDAAAIGEVLERYAGWDLGALQVTLAEVIAEAEQDGWRDRELAASVEALRLVIAMRELE